MQKKGLGICQAKKGSNHFMLMRGQGSPKGLAIEPAALLNDGSVHQHSHHTPHYYSAKGGDASDPTIGPNSLRILVECHQ